MRLHNASFPSGRTRELCLDFFAAVATLNSLRDANLWGRGSMFEQRRGSWTSFQTSSSGLISGEYGGRKNSREAVLFHLVHRSDAPTLALCAGNPSTTRKIFFG